jgi:hypothetical protein
VVRGAGGGRVSIAGVACYRPGDRPHLFYVLCAYRRRKGEAKGFTWTDYRDLITATHHHLSAPPGLSPTSPPPTWTAWSASSSAS